MSQYLYLSTSKFSFLKTGTISKIGASDLPQKTKKCLDILSASSLSLWISRYSSRHKSLLIYMIYKLEKTEDFRIHMFFQETHQRVIAWAHVQGKD